MVYIFEGARNSGKTHLSRHISKKFGIPRFQFDFIGGFNLLKLQSKNNREAHSFSMGKELMLMQLTRDLALSVPDFIHDRGILSVLSWGLSENRISKEEVETQIKYIKENRLLDNCIIIYIEGDNPDKSERNKDQWDYADTATSEKNSLEFVIGKFSESGINKIYRFRNNFDEKSITNIEYLFEHILFE